MMCVVQGQVERKFVATSSPRSRDHRDTADNLELGPGGEM